MPPAGIVTTSPDHPFRQYTLNMGRRTSGYYGLDPKPLDATRVLPMEFNGLWIQFIEKEVAGEEGFAWLNV